MQAGERGQLYNVRARVDCGFSACTFDRSFVHRYFDSFFSLRQMHFREMTFGFNYYNNNKIFFLLLFRFSSPIAVTTFVVSAIVSNEHKLDMVHVQNSTLAGGVAVGSVCNMLIGPHGALLIGFISAVVSVFGYRYLSVRERVPRRVQSLSQSLLFFHYD